MTPTQIQILETAALSGAAALIQVLITNIGNLSLPAAVIPFATAVLTTIAVAVRNYFPPTQGK